MANPVLDVTLVGTEVRRLFARWQRIVERMLFLDEQTRTALALTMLGALGTTLGGVAVIVHPGMSLRHLAVLQGIAAGLMICISFMDLLSDATETIGFTQAHTAFYLGAAFFGMITAFLPEPDLDSMLAQNHSTESESKTSKNVRREILMSGLITAVGIALHNFPEGISVFLASMKSTATGLNLAIAIALHNIPEGVAVALPVYFATKSRWTGFKYATLSGLAEPLAVIIMAFLLPMFNLQLSSNVVDFTVASVGGIMAFISLHELVPLSMEHCGKFQMTVAVFIGMALMSVNLSLLHS